MIKVRKWTELSSYEVEMEMQSTEYSNYVKQLSGLPKSTNSVYEKFRWGALPISKSHQLELDPDPEDKQ